MSHIIWAMLRTHTVGVSTLYIFNVPNSEIVYQRKFILQIINYHLVGWNKLQLFTYNCTIWTFRFQIHYLMAVCVDAYVDGFRLQVGILFVGYLLWWISLIFFDESEIKIFKLHLIQGFQGVLIGSRHSHVGNISEVILKVDGPQSVPGTTVFKSTRLYLYKIVLGVLV